MTKKELSNLLNSFKRGAITSEAVIERFSGSMVEDIEFARVDHHRELRQGFPEVVLCEGKTGKQVAEISRRIVTHGSTLLATRATKSHFAAVRKFIPRAVYNDVGRTISAGKPAPHHGRGTILIVTAGTSDLPVAEEA